jgi:hypothetical protein
VGGDGPERSSGLVGAARKIGASFTRSISARYSAASSTIMSVSRTPSTPASAAASANLASPKRRMGLKIGKDDQARFGAGIAKFASEAQTSLRRVPRARARSLARWMTGPSASGSLKGTPSSMTSAPASMAARAISREADRSTRPARAVRVARECWVKGRRLLQ